MSDVKSEIEVKIAFIADDIRIINEFELNHNATFSLMLASQDLGARVFLTESNNLKILNSKVLAKFDEVSLRPSLHEHLKVKNTLECSLDSFNIIFARKDPPFNQNYLSYIYKLCLVERENTLIVNEPQGILKANEKLYALNLDKLIPPTLVSANENEILSFLNEYKKVVIKPIFNKGGEGVSYLEEDSKDSISIIKKSISGESRVALVQKYIPDIKAGDKRIILLNGDPLGFFSRVPKEGEFRANLDRGASVKPYTPNKRDLEICEALKPYLQRDGLYFTSIDIIGEYLIEVNVTCPAGIREAERCMDKPLGKEIVGWAIKKALGSQPLVTSRIKRLSQS